MSKFNKHRDPLDSFEAGKAQLEAHCDTLNRHEWVKRSGAPFYVSSHERGGQTVHFVHRKGR